jgi:streptomycin 6-kinase
MEIQPNVRAYAESLGAPGQRWLASLPDAVERQRLEWSLDLGETLPGGSRSFVCRVTTADGNRAVLKLALPEPILETQITTLVAARGCGYVRVLAHDLERGALLLESLGQSIAELLEDVPDVLLVTARTLLQAWKVQLEQPIAISEVEEYKAAGLHALVRNLSSHLHDPNMKAVVAQALRYARERLEDRDPKR